MLEEPPFHTSNRRDNANGLLSSLVIDSIRPEYDTSCLGLDIKTYGTSAFDVDSYASSLQITGRIIWYVIGNAFLGQNALSSWLESRTSEIPLSRCPAGRVLERILIQRALVMHYVCCQTLAEIKSTTEPVLNKFPGALTLIPRLSSRGPPAEFFRGVHGRGLFVEECAASHNR